MNSLVTGKVRLDKYKKNVSMATISECWSVSRLLHVSVGTCLGY